MLDLSLLSSLSGVTDGSTVLDPSTVAGGDNSVSLADWCVHLALPVQLALALFFVSHAQRQMPSTKKRMRRGSDAACVHDGANILAWCGAGTRLMIRGAPTS